jgi:hypothetical protein
LVLTSSGTGSARVGMGNGWSSCLGLGENLASIEESRSRKLTTVTVAVASAVVTVTVTGTHAPEPLAPPAGTPKTFDPEEDPEVTGSTVMYTVDVEVELNVVVISVGLEPGTIWFIFPEAAAPDSAPEDPAGSVA